MGPVIRSDKTVVPVLLLIAGLYAPIASADDNPAPKTTATRPAKEHPNETSAPSMAPPATRTQETGSNSQDPTIKKMNADEKKKLEIEGK
jgi:hypothetical protein